MDRDDTHVPASAASTDWRFWRKAAPVLLVLIAFVIFLIQNAEPVQVEFLAWSLETRRAFVLIAAAVVGALTWELLRHRARRRSKQ